jgi:hypothetical protein
LKISLPRQAATTTAFAPIYKPTRSDQQLFNQLFSYHQNRIQQRGQKKQKLKHYQHESRSQFRLEQTAVAIPPQSTIQSLAASEGGDEEDNRRSNHHPQQAVVDNNADQNSRSQVFDITTASTRKLYDIPSQGEGEYHLEGRVRNISRVVFNAFPAMDSYLEGEVWKKLGMPRGDQHHTRTKIVHFAGMR